MRRVLASPRTIVSLVETRIDRRYKRTKISSRRPLFGFHLHEIVSSFCKESINIFSHWKHLLGFCAEQTWLSQPLQFLSFSIHHVTDCGPQIKELIFHVSTPASPSWKPPQVPEDSTNKIKISIWYFCDSKENVWLKTVFRTGCPEWDCVMSPLQLCTSTTTIDRSPTRRFSLPYTRTHTHTHVHTSNCSTLSRKVSAQFSGIET